MSDRQKLADAKDWAEGQRKCTPNWYGLTLLDALTEAEDKYDRLREALDNVQEELDTAQEINPSNYDHEQVCAMNRAYCAAYNIIDAALQEARDE